MANRKKVIKGLKSCSKLDGKCHDCPYVLGQAGCIRNLMIDALELLEKDEKEFMRHYEQGRKDEAAIARGEIMQTFSPD